LQYGVTHVDRYKTLVLDECHRIKNPKPQNPKTPKPQV